MAGAWTHGETDPVCGRQIFARAAAPMGTGDTGTYAFRIARDFKARSAEGALLLQS